MDTDKHAQNVAGGQSTRTHRPRVVAMYDERVKSLPSKQDAADVRVVLVSDTHNADIPTSLLPDGDLLLHAGDHTRAGTKEELLSASAWLRTVAARYPFGCITIGGNHDLPLDTDSFVQWRSLGASISDAEAYVAGHWTEEEVRDAPSTYFSNSSVRILNHEAITVAGLTIFGSPYVPLSPSKEKKFPAGHPGRSIGFNRDDTALVVLWAKIPANCDVLMTHTPAHDILDASVQYGGVPRDKPIAIGSTALRDRLKSMSPESRPALHVFGHEHDARGVLRDDTLNVWFVNAAAVDGDREVLRNGGNYTLKHGFRATVVDFRL